MIISDLNYLEVVTEGNQIEGGWRYFIPKSSYASAGANALAFGRNTSAYTSAQTLAAPGVSASSSYASSSSYGGY
jgi:hypothetical protein